MLIRQSAPVFGASQNTYLQPGEWQVNASFRTLKSDKHYVLGEQQYQRTELGTNVINRQKMMDLSGTYAFTTRFNLSVSVPVVVASWSIPSPTAPVPGPRATQHGQGVGDASVVGRYWLFDTDKHGGFNIALGSGIKLPTGAFGVTDTFPDLTGKNPASKAVDQSVQPGDGGWGIMFEVQGFKRVKRALIFGSANYLANPRDTNGTPSVIVGLGRANPANAGRQVNSVPDQYLVRIGAGISVWRGLAVSAAWRVEGLRRYDLLGRSDGFRRPGTEMFIEPGVSYTIGGSTWAFNLPRAFYRIRRSDPYTGALGDATFPQWIALASYSYRFGKTGTQGVQVCK